MSQIITNAFASYWQDCLTNETPVVLDQFVLANIPGLDPDAPLDPDEGLPPPEQIVHRHSVDQRGRINTDTVVYTIVMDTTVGDFEFNAMYLINQANGVVGMVVHKGMETKLKTDEATGQTGNSLVKSMLMGYDRASEATVTVVEAGTWQIDYAARLRGMDDDLRLQARQYTGPATFYGDGFKLVNEEGIYKVQPGVAYVGGLRAQLDEVQKVSPGAKPVGLWLDVYRAGTLLSTWVNHATLTLSVADLSDYVDANGYQHYVAKVATVNADESVTDTRRQRIIMLSGDVSGQSVLEESQSIDIKVTIQKGSHRHPWSELDDVPATMPPSAHRHPWTELDNVPATMPPSAHRHPWGELDGIPETMPPSAHSHPWSQVEAPARVKGEHGEIIPEGEYNQLLSQSGFFNNSGGLGAYGDPFPGQWSYLFHNSHGNESGFCGSLAMNFGATGLRYGAISAGAGTGWKKVFTENEPPTPAEVGAAPAVHGHTPEECSAAPAVHGHDWSQIANIPPLGRNLLGDGAGSPEVIIGAAGLGMITVALLRAGRICPVTLHISWGQVTVVNRGGENADKDYDLVLECHYDDWTLYLHALANIDGIGQVFG